MIQLLGDDDLVVTFPEFYIINLADAWRPDEPPLTFHNSVTLWPR